MSTGRSTSQSVITERAVPVAWRSWPLVDQRRWSWLVMALLVAVGGGVWFLGGGWLLAVVVTLGLATTLWKYFMPIDYELAPLGLRRRVLGRTRVVPWHSIRAYRLRPSGVVLYQRSEAGVIDLLRSMFVPFPPDADDLVSAMRQYASHAAEVPQSAR